MAKNTKTQKSAAKVETASTEAVEVQNAAPAATEAKTEPKPERVTKRGQAIAIMKANEAKEMNEVCKLISEAIGVTETAARSYYRFIVENGMGPGKVVKQERVPGQPRGNGEVRPDSKRGKAIAVMTANGDKVMDDVLPLIAAECGIDVGQARSYYAWIVANGKAPGVVTKKAPKPKAEKAAKQTASKPQQEPTRSPEEIAAAKAANLKKMKELREKKAEKAA